MTRPPLLTALLAAALLLAGAAQVWAASAAPRPTELQVERVVMLFRHGVRAPLPGEAAEDLAVQPWPKWSTPAGRLTPHGREGMRRLGAYDRLRFAAQGLLPAAGCPALDQIVIWTNTAERTVASGEALAEGLAPGCGLSVGHLSQDGDDPLFYPLQAGLAPFDARTAAAAINRQTGGARRLAAPYREEIRTVEAILGCRSCALAERPAAIQVGADGQGIELTGPLALVSGTAEVFLLQYAEGLPLEQVGWGRASRERLGRISRLHALPFEVYSRADYMAPRAGALLGRRVLAVLKAQAAPKLTLLVGHDDNIAALTSLLGVHFQVPGYALDDPPMGGALGLEVLRDRRTGVGYVRTFYQAQTLDQLRTLQPLDLTRPPSVQALRVKDCAIGASDLCRLKDFIAVLDRRLAL